MSDFTIKSLTSETFDDFAALVERNKGMFASCWCTWFHPGIHHRKEYLATAERLPDYRITCIQVEKVHRGKGVASVALRGAVDLIAQAGGGVVEGYP
ncbi:MAG: family N-acetyltransferase, partial [Nocardioidaceae bacterium]|nr:family N-acetyltransferase [Nocardioidaceae bacterium]